MNRLLATISLCIFLIPACAPVAVVQYATDPPTAVVQARTLTTSTTPAPAAAVTANRAVEAPSPLDSPAEPAAATSTTGSTATLVETTAVVPTGAPVATDTGQIPVTASGIPVFDHIVIIVLENHSFNSIIGSSRSPIINALAEENVLLTQYYGVRHPSLPNYIALISGDTHGIAKNCTDCFLPHTSLPDLIEASGRTWKTYQEDMPSPCFVGNARPYMQKHNPFIYFDNIRLDAERCSRSVVPLTQLDTDLANNQLPNFVFITPNMCNSSHDCSRTIADAWIGEMVTKLRSSPALGENSLIVITYDEAGSKNKESCCGLAKSAGGRIATVLISPQAKPAFQDSTPYSHYSLLKTILTAWGLPELGKTTMPETMLIVEPWK